MFWLDSLAWFDNETSDPSTEPFLEILVGRPSFGLDSEQGWLVLGDPRAAMTFLYFADLTTRRIFCAAS